MIDRYDVPEMSMIWSRRSRFERWLQIELLAVEARAEAGEVPAEDLRKIRKGARFDPDRIDVIEREVRHDVVAFLTNVSESLGDESRHLHYGMTSSDVLDTCLATQIRDSGKLLLDALDIFRSELAGLAGRCRGMACVGRTHGMAAEPTTMALKFAGFVSECDRCRHRLDDALDQSCVGKLSGAVGTYAHLDPYVEEYVCGKLGIRAERVATQVVPRDRHASFLNALAGLGCLMERFGMEVRHLQRSEVGEVEESFGKGQKGSSAMHHKRNPIVSERLCGMARLLRGYMQVGTENTALWHERDISHSSAERFVFPDACGVALYSLRKAGDLARGLRLFPERISANLEKAGGGFYSQSVLLALIDKGMTRERAYSLVQSIAMKASEQCRGFVEAVLQSEEVTSVLPPREISSLCTLERLLRNEDAILARLALLDPEEKAKGE
jgi:adenylosuccinate lyase